MFDTLFPPLAPETEKDFSALGRALDATAPLKGRHRLELPGNVRLLSGLLTEERQGLRRDYMGDPATLAAYLRFFLPWNVYRMARLFTGLGLDLPEEATVIDLGAGPLTVALALWIARPDLRRRRLHIVCLDRTPKPMRLGQDILRSLAGEDLPWRVTAVKGTLGKPLREKADLLTLANTLNEISWSGQQDLEAPAWRAAESLARMLKPSGRLLAVEPGVRTSARVLAALREAALELGMIPLAPCPHAEACPMPGEGKGPWCHFNFDTRGVPTWLTRLSQEADLTKRNVSLSFLYLGSENAKVQADAQDMARAVSEPFALPDGARGQYACSGRGLTLIRIQPGDFPLAPGTAVAARWPEEDSRDRKSGALVLPLGGLRKVP